MSDFIFIVPPDWTELPKVATDAIGVGTLTAWIAGGNLPDMTLALQEGGFIPTNKNVLEAQIFNGEILVVRLGDM